MRSIKHRSRLSGGHIDGATVPGPNREKREVFKECIACHKKRRLSEIYRYVISPDGILLLDKKNEMKGVSYYSCPKEECIRQGYRESCSHLKLYEGIPLEYIQWLDGSEHRNECQCYICVPSKIIITDSNYQNLEKNASIDALSQNTSGIHELIINTCRKKVKSKWGECLVCSERQLSTTRKCICGAWLPWAAEVKKGYRIPPPSFTEVVQEIETLISQIED